ncbi:MAG: pyrroloquinoline quinone biosynthesis peptide chaperone PqqD [Mastigocoleus sp. MO_167.B18]|uniref:pyrroloquinoline quinone biosynthesis peptide chaperone PqqD n=1 Tax=Mastigocoleus sp. MO_188.B34 TaxID=3036635 RepID=UPI00261713E2|nr:pyrroloquinoline quinone biosynthesis peptide chaperone PqqD [Mastigocoleus sp. MO_188.B34]MDJ0694244.1 pyrroloquinoline quinone biosynthesis peptide chaperone PqqD [Mastigocoleus sp. MO_188.B34]MDJ0775797.1 pyrroloquinoline quinone biosynthesis peptide chaperone PqqD [Mastigocoleus sp. MO_167.B18]
MFIKIHSDTRPYLAPGVRLFWDEVRQQSFLLFPEGTLVLNKTALAILELCNCECHTVSEIIAELTIKYPSPNIDVDVHHFLSQLAARGLVRFESNKSNKTPNNL